MPTSALDHLNVLTDDLEATVTFFENALELRQGDTPLVALGHKGAWMYDTQNNPIVHIVWNDPAKSHGAGRTPGESTNAVHHVAFRCTGFFESQERLTRLGLEHRVNDGIGGLRQIMVTDPNGITIEMNFHGD